MTHAEIIEALGGTTRLADALGLSPQVVTNWKSRQISDAGKFRIRDYAERIGFKLPKGFMDT